MRRAAHVLSLLVLVVTGDVVQARPVDCRLGSVAFGRLGYVIDIANPRAQIVAHVVPGWSRDPIFDWIPNDIASPVLYQDPQLLGLVWSSSDPSIVAVDRAGGLTAASVGTATVTARAVQITPQSASVSVVALGSRSVLISADDVVGRTLQELDLRRSKATRALRAGAIVVVDDGSLVARLVDAEPGLAHTLRFRIGPVAPEEAFTAGSVSPSPAASCS